MKNKTNKKKSAGLSRRKFVGMSAMGAAGFTILPSFTINGVN